ncbi:MAG: hypothetical protein M1835_001462 [Candelina submexicana]|nr:MAG: hypothetical protein M1835_001462 [Candelina submexicana]
MLIAKRLLLWDWTNSGANGVPWAMDKVALGSGHLISSVSNWNTWVPPELKGRAPYRPMVRTKGQLSGQDWANVENTNEQIIHFFNEPERQSISVNEAVDIWNKQMVPLRTKKGKKLVSPSCANDQNGQNWIEDFMKKVQGSPPDYLGLHYYGTKGEDAIGFIEKMHNKFPKPPVIVSEIASISRDKNEVLQFTAKTVNWMDQTGYIYEYGFFGCMRKLADNFVSPAAQLMNADGTFTDLMNKLMYDQPMKA